jgi:hypothetical protein
MSTSALQRLQVLGRYRELLRLLQRLPDRQKLGAFEEARSTIRQRKDESNPHKALEYQKELVARISFLKITTPRPVGRVLEAGKYVFRKGEWVQGEAEGKGTRCEAKQVLLVQAPLSTRQAHKESSSVRIDRHALS